MPTFVKAHNRRTRSGVVSVRQHTRSNILQLRAAKVGHAKALKSARLASTKAIKDANIRAADNHFRVLGEASYKLKSKIIRGARTYASAVRLLNKYNVNI